MLPVVSQYDCYGTICKTAPFVKWCTICHKIGTKYEYFCRFALHQMSVFSVPYVTYFLICTISKKRCTIRKMQTKSLGVIYRGNIYTLYYVIVLSLLSTSSSSSPSLSSSSPSSSSSTTTLTDALPTELTSYSIRLVDNNY